MREYYVDFILHAGTKIVEAESEEDAAAIVQEMSDEELMEGAEIDDIVQDVREVEMEDDEEEEIEEDDQ